MKKAIFIAMLAGIFVLSSLQNTEAFCIYNESDVKIKITQNTGHVPGKAFSDQVLQGHHKCFDWKNKDYNQEGDKNSTLSFSVDGYITFFLNSRINICQDIFVKAGGWLTVRGSIGNYNCQAHYSEIPSFYQPFPDTGQQVCYDNSQQIECPSPGNSFYGQDPQFSRLPRSYTKLGFGGEKLPEDAISAYNGGKWTMTKDNITGLIWEVKTPDNMDDSYPYYNLFKKDIYDYVSQINNKQLGGFSDWRVPTIKELSSLVYSGETDPAIYASRFPYTAPSYYWSLNPYLGKHDDLHDTYTHAWAVHFETGKIQFQKKSTQARIRVVRGNKSKGTTALIDNGNGTVSDPSTGLIWMKCALGQSWNSEDSSCEGEPKRYTWEEALQEIYNLKWAGYTDWRMPSRNEMQSLVDYTQFNPATDPLLSDCAQWSFLWTTTTVKGNSDQCWHQDIFSGNVDIRSKSPIIWYAWPVRGGYSVESIQTYTNANILFSRIESCFPELFTTSQETLETDGLLYRCYPNTEVCIGTFQNELYYLNEQGKVHNLGSVNTMLELLESFTGWAVGGERGDTYTPKIIHTDSRGEQWQVQELPTSLYGCSLNDISVVDSENAWVVGGTASGDSLVLKTHDGGQNWVQVTPPAHISMNKELLGVTAVDMKKVWAVGWDGLILSSLDSGTTWQKHDAGIPNAFLNAVEHFDGCHIWAVGHLDQDDPDSPPALVTSSDCGETWQKIEDPILDSANYLIDLSVFDNDTVWVVGHNYFVAKTEDRGQSWTKLYEGPPYDANDVSVVSPEKAWVVTDQGGIYSFTNSGTDCKKQSVPTEAHGFHLLDVSAISSQEAWVFGSGWGQDTQGIILHTQDGGKTWERQDMPINAELQSGEFANAIR